MIALPFIYFTYLFIRSYRKRGFDVYAYIILLYIIISFFSILIDVMGYYNRFCLEKPLGIVAPILYCTLLTICVWPFYKFDSNNIKSFKLPNKLWLFDVVVYFYFAIFFIILTVSLTKIQEILLSNLAEIRNTQYLNEVESFYNHLHGFPRMICAMCSILAPSAFIMILFFFYSITFLNKSILFNLMILAGSLSPLPISINIADRSQFFYWILLCGLSFTLFYKYFTKETWRIVKFVLTGVLLAFGIYFLMVTVSRFGDRDGGTGGGIILYAGQSYINFCSFFNYLDYPNISFTEIFPFTYRYILNELSYFEMCEKIYLATGIHINVFSTFLGLILSISGTFVTIVYCFFYHVISKIVLTRSKKNVLTFNGLIIFWIVAIVPVLGLLGYFYAFANATIAIFVWLLIGLFVQKKLVVK